MIFGRPYIAYMRRIIATPIIVISFRQVGFASGLWQLTFSINPKNGVAKLPRK